jgi:electron transfer flavoprotein alpha/beta subunit
LAEALGYAQVTDVHALSIEAGTLLATRRWGTAEPVYATVEAVLPAVVTVAAEAFPPRYAHGARIMSAYRDWDVPVWDMAYLDLDEAALPPLLALRREGFPPPLEVGERFRGDPADVAQEALMALKLQKLIG